MCSKVEVGVLDRIPICMIAYDIDTTVYLLSTLILVKVTLCALMETSDL